LRGGNRIIGCALNLAQTRRIADSGIASVIYGRFAVPIICPGPGDFKTSGSLRNMVRMVLGDHPNLCATSVADEYVMCSNTVFNLFPEVF
jgi:hypothetical protein